MDIQHPFRVVKSFPLSNPHVAAPPSQQQQSKTIIDCIAVACVLTHTTVKTLRGDGASRRKNARSRNPIDIQTRTHIHNRAGGKVRMSHVESGGFGNKGKAAARDVRR